jgi:hypothetical protein
MLGRRLSCGQIVAATGSNDQHLVAPLLLLDKEAELAQQDETQVPPRPSLYDRLGICGGVQVRCHRVALSGRWRAAALLRSVDGRLPPAPQ